MLLDALDNDVRVPTVILGDHRKRLDDRSRVYCKVREPGEIVSAERVWIEVEDRLGNGGWGVVGVGRYNGRPIALGLVGHLRVGSGGLWIERHGGQTSSRTRTKNRELGTVVQPMVDTGEEE